VKKIKIFHKIISSKTDPLKKLISCIVLFLVAIPFYSQVQSYYNGLDLTKTENDLFLELSNRIISTHSAIPYTGSPIDVWDACKLADEDPDISENVLLIYGYTNNDGIPDTDKTRNKNLQDTGSGNSGVWNREHVFPKSLANPQFGTDEPGPGTDVHNLRPADRDRNSTRSNRKFTDGSGNSGIISANGGWYPGDEWKGDVARIVMYMYLRYHGSGSQVSQTNCLPINVGFGESLDSDLNMIDLFLKWNKEDPVSNFEANRNEILSEIQMNRNPFIDNPYIATLIWGGVNAEDKWNLNNTSDSEAPTAPTNLISASQTDESIEISWNASTDNIGVVDYLIYLNGVYLKTAFSTSSTILGLAGNTNYTISVKARDASSNLSLESNVLNIKTLEGPLILLSEDFSNCSDLQFSTFNEASNKNWVCETQYGENNTGSIGVNGYQQDVLSKDWLITNSPINFDLNYNEKISFYTDAAYGTSHLELLFSTDYDGVSNPVNFTWQPVPNITIPEHSNGSGTEEVYTFLNVDISSITGTVYFGFKYYANDEPTRWTVDSFKITADNNDDLDDDGILNENDLCPNTPIGETIDATGCSNGQLDDDNDGIQNSDDLCPNTPIGETVNTSGCSESQLDDDEDGVMNNLDECENTPNGEIINATGCSNGQLDDDNDGIQNSDDLCANTPIGETVNTSGCSESQLDDDEDGVMNNLDECENTPNGEMVNTNGCSESQLDDDNDGVMNDKDLCPNSTIGINVDISGCFKLPSNNFKIETISETCPNKNNGQILITATESFVYDAIINGTNYNFSNNSLTVENLTPTLYDICIIITSEGYEQCFKVEIEEGITISGKSTSISGKVSFDIEQGTAPFKVFINDKMTLETHSKTFDIDAKHGDLIEVKTTVACEGLLSKTANFFNEIIAYPNPSNGNFEITLPVEQKEVIIELYNIQSQLISVKTYPVNYGKVHLNIENKPAGIYLVKVNLEEPVLLKIIKE
jgi:endonuclease I